MDCSLPGSSAHGISHAKILGWDAISSPAGIPDLEIEPASPCIGGLVVKNPPMQGTVASEECLEFR